jgi:coenzyme PQQ precursor peptide PqqA
LHAPDDHGKNAAELEPAPSPDPLEKSRREEQDAADRVQSEEMTMAWTTPVIVEVCVGMEVTSYSSAEI